MEILEILEKSGKDLYPEDLDFFETELATGTGYKAAYRAQCRSLICQIRKWQKGEIKEETSSEKSEPKGIEVDIQKIVPQKATSALNLSPEEMFFKDIS